MKTKTSTAEKLRSLLNKNRELRDEWKDLVRRVKDEELNIRQMITRQMGWPDYRNESVEALVERCKRENALRKPLFGRCPVEALDEAVRTHDELLVKCNDSKAQMDACLDEIHKEGKSAADSLENELSEQYQSVLDDASQALCPFCEGDLDEAKRLAESTPAAEKCYGALARLRKARYEPTTLAARVLDIIDAQILAESGNTGRTPIR